MAIWDALLDAYRAGATKQQVAEQFKISLSSVKRQLRKHGVKRERG
ncbi:MAG TPA: helix-turn-helix domain-containing protein [Candidatus Saccharimonadales bacterium]|nr:helix-turn-helix domain-containing protein [Candidatus Saccharimonadales bacterium]